MLQHKRFRRAATAVTAALALGMTLLPTLAAEASPHQARANVPCSTDMRIGYAHCMSRVRGASRPGARVPDGYGTKDLRAAYRLPTTGARSSVAIVIAFDVANAEKDLAVYRRTMGLPPCTTANGCFRKVNQYGRSGELPQPDEGWALEGSLDLQMVSSGCPTCTILLVEGDDNSFVNLATASRTAGRLGASVISNSYGGNEFGSLWTYRDSYEQSGPISVASSGDDGFGTAQIPAAYRKVLAVGGTSLTRATGTARGWDETVWSGAGSGCSAYIAKSPWQHDKHCQQRTVADVSAVADPNTGVAVYDSYPNPYGLPPGWLVLGGTSASTPLVAGMIGSRGNGTAFTNKVPYDNRGAFFDVIGGSNGFCGGDYLCTGLKGYDAPSGIGTPNGLGGL